MKEQLLAADFLSCKPKWCFWILFTDSEEALWAITLASVQSASTQLPVQPVCSSSLPLLTQPDPQRDFRFQTSKQPKHPLRPGLPRPFSDASQQPLELWKPLLRTHACFYTMHCFSFGPLRARRHLLSTLPAVAHSLLTWQNNRPASWWHAHRTEITQDRVCYLETERVWCLASLQVNTAAQALSNHSLSVRFVAFRWLV